MQFLLDKLKHYYDADVCTVEVSDQESMRLLFSVGDNDAITALTTEGQQQNPATMIFAAKEPVVLIPDAAKDGDSLPQQQFLRQAGFGTYIGYPMLERGNTCVGVLSLYFKKKKRVRAQDLDLLSSYACRICLELENAGLQARLAGMREAVEHHTTIDQSTGVYKRAHLLDRLDQEFRRAKRYGRPLSCILFGVSNYDDIVDRYGVNFTNGVLRVLAGVLKGWIREIDYLFRFSACEFFIVLPETALDQTFLLGERLRDRLENQKLIASEIVKSNPDLIIPEKLGRSDDSIAVKIKLGLSSYPSDGVSTSAELINVTEASLTPDKASDTYVN